MWRQNRFGPFGSLPTRRSSRGSEKELRARVGRVPGSLTPLIPSSESLQRSLDDGDAENQSYILSAAIDSAIFSAVGDVGENTHERRILMPKPALLPHFLLLPKLSPPRRPTTLVA